MAILYQWFLETWVICLDRPDQFSNMQVTQSAMPEIVPHFSLSHYYHIQSHQFFNSSFSLQHWNRALIGKFETNTARSQDSNFNRNNQ